MTGQQTVAQEQLFYSFLDSRVQMDSSLPGIR